MKRVLIAGALSLLVFTACAEASPRPSLKMFEARSAAEGEVFDFQVRRHLDSSSIGRCARKSPTRVLCAGTATGEEKTQTTTCMLRVRVREVHRTYYWDKVASIVGRHCTVEAKAFLTYDAARTAIQAEADKFAGKPTTITALNREDDVTFNGTAEWERPSDPPNEFLPTETCSVRMVATLASGDISVANNGFLCY